MERNIHMDEFEEFLKEKADQYKVYPSDKIWNNINRSVHPRKKWAYIALTLFLLSGTAVLVDYNNYIFPGKKSLSQQHIIFTPIATADISTKRAADSESSITNSSISQQNQAKAVSHDGDAVHPADRTLIAVNRPNTKTSMASDENYNNALISNQPAFESKMGAQKNTIATKKPPVAEAEEEEKVVRKIILWGGEVFRKSKFKWQLSFSPTVSYRRLTSGLGEITDVFRGIPYSTAKGSTSVNNLVTHKPAVGAEVGASLVYKLSDNFILKGGLQLNYSRYQLKAYSSKPAITTLALNNDRGGTDSINFISTMENYEGGGSKWYNNEYLQISLPVGFEWSVLGSSSTFKWNIGASAQPVYNFANNVYLLSTDFKHYVQDPSLIRKWNINAGVETFISYDMGSFKWQAGPQLRYQLQSSYKSAYPIKEHLVDFGFKIGITKTLR